MRGQAGPPGTETTAAARRGRRTGTLWARLNAWGMRWAGPVWPSRYFGAPFRGMLAHHRGPGGLRAGHAQAFHEMTAGQGLDASSYFRSSGISACAEANGGVCTFRMGRRIAIYQITNAPMTRDEDLAPSTDSNRELFGDFMGSLHAQDPERPAKRLAVESVLGNAKFIERLEPHIRGHAREYLAAAAGRDIPTDEFALSLVAHVDSLVPGVLDFAQRPLPEFLDSAEFGRVVREFFTLASNVISNVDRGAMKEFDVIVPFVRTLLHENAAALSEAPDTNLVRRHFAHWGVSFGPTGIDRLQPAQLKELGTTIVAVYDTTALSLLWALAYLESLPEQKYRVVAEARAGGSPARGLSHAQLAVLEAVRLGGSNPTALWRAAERPFTLHHRGRAVRVPAGTMMWLDRRQANQDPVVYPAPRTFSTSNIQAICATPRETVSSLLSRNRYEVNSFSMINAERNPRKCPGRLFSVQMQAVLLNELYGHYEVRAHGIDLALRRAFSMPRPAGAGVIALTPLRREPGEGETG